MTTRKAPRGGVLVRAGALVGFAFIIYWALSSGAMFVVTGTIGQSLTDLVMN